MKDYQVVAIIAALLLKDKVSGYAGFDSKSGVVPAAVKSAEAILAASRDLVRD